MRLDRYMVACGLLSRKECAAAARAGRIAVNGTTVRRPDTVVEPLRDAVTLDGAAVHYSEFVYLWLNKPEGYVSATEDGRLPVVTELMPPEVRRMGVFPCGRLDRDTVGLMLITNDGVLAHRLLSPRFHVEKAYRFTCSIPLPDGAEQRFARGIVLDGEQCLPARLSMDDQRTGGTVTLTEGRYHQIKRMVESEGSRVVALERISFAGIPLDPTLPRGGYRYCTEEEIARLRADAETKDKQRKGM